MADALSRRVSSKGVEFASIVRRLVPEWLREVQTRGSIGSRDQVKTECSRSRLLLINGARKKTPN